MRKNGMSVIKTGRRFPDTQKHWFQFICGLSVLRLFTKAILDVSSLLGQNLTLLSVDLGCKHLRIILNPAY